MTDQEAQIREDALEVLREIPFWELAVGRWERLVEILDVAAAAEAAGDLDALTHAVMQLELSGPVRITRIGAAPTEPPPPVVRERVNQLVHRLSGGKEGQR